MPRILVQPESLKSFASRVCAGAEEIDYSISRLGSAISSLDWQTLQTEGIETEWAHAKNFGTGLTREADALAQYLVTKANAFADADHASAVGLNQVNVMSVTMQQQMKHWLQLRPSFTFPQRTIQNVLRLGDDSLQVQITRVDGLVSNSILGTQTIRRRVPLIWIEQLTNAVNPIQSSSEG